MCNVVTSYWPLLQYVDNLLATLAGFQPELQSLLQQLENQVHLTAQASAAEAAKFAGGSKGSPTGKRTMPEPFNLTQPKPKLLPIEEALPPPIKCVFGCNNWLDFTALTNAHWTVYSNMEQSAVLLHHAAY